MSLLCGQLILVTRAAFCNPVTELILVTQAAFSNLVTEISSSSLWVVKIDSSNN